MLPLTNVVARTSDGFRRAYLVALSLIAVCAVASFAFLHASIDSMESDAAVMNVSGEQKALIQRAALLAGAAHNAANEDERKYAIDELDRIVGRLEAAHKGLIEGDAGRGLPGNPSEAMRALYFEYPFQVDTQLQSFLQVVRQLVDEAREGYFDSSAGEYVALLGRGRLMQGYNRVVDQYQDEAHARVVRTQLILLAILLFTLSLLAIVAWFIFRPAARSIEEKTKEILESKAELDHAADHDALTGLANRRRSEEMLKAAIAEVERTGGRAGVLHVDLDGFKAVNDTLGHAAGDDVLSQVADRLRRSVRRGDTVARVGGDEFVIICPGNGEDSDDEGVAERVMAKFAAPFTLADNVRVDVGCSIGIARYPGDAENAEDLLIAADLALYRAKETGKNRTVLFDPPMRKNFQDKIALASRIKQAIDAGEFEVFYQPQIEIDTGRIVGVESLLRWRDPERGLRAPGEFFEAIERSGTSLKIGWMVMDRAIATAARWHQQGIGFGRIALNISAAQLRDSDFIDTLLGRLMAHGLPPACLAIEIVESVMITGQDRRLRSVLDELNDLEISIEFDDFGTGYASLTHLRQLPVNRIKIDRSFITELAESEDHRSIVRGVINVFQRLGLAVIAEGVETVDQARLLNSWGCRCAQGFLFAEPMPDEEVTGYLKLADYKRSLSAVSGTRVERPADQAGLNAAS